MYDYIEHNQFAPLYFISFITITTFVMLNMFIMVILTNFTQYRNNPDNPVLKFNHLLKKFKQSWIKWSAPYGGMKMQSVVLIDFFQDLPPELGFEENALRFNVAQEINRLDIYYDKDLYVYFRDVLYHVFRRVFRTFEFTN